MAIVSELFLKIRAWQRSWSPGSISYGPIRFSKLSEKDFLRIK